MHDIDNEAPRRKYMSKLSILAEFWQFMKAIVDEIWANESLADVAGIRPADAKKQFQGLFNTGEVELVRPEDLEVVSL